MTVQSGKSKPGSNVQHVTWDMVEHVAWEVLKLSSSGGCVFLFVAGVPNGARCSMSKLWLASHMQLFRTVNAAHRRIYGGH